MVRSNTHLSFSASHFPKLMFYWLFYKFKTWNFEKEIWKRKNWKFERIWFGSCLSAKVKAEICLDFQLREFQLKLRHLNCHNKSAANVSVLLWKQWGGLSTRQLKSTPLLRDSIYDTIVWLVSRENYFMAFQFMFPLWRGNHYRLHISFYTITLLKIQVLLLASLLKSLLVIA